MPRLLGGLGVAIMAASLAQANSIYLPAQTLGFGTIGPSGGATLYFDKFDSKAYSNDAYTAVLNSVELDVNSVSSGTFLALNTDGAPGSYLPFYNGSTTLPLAINAAGLVNYTVTAAVDKCGAFLTPTPTAAGCVNGDGGVSGYGYAFGTPGLATAGALTNAVNAIGNMAGTVSTRTFVNPLNYASYQSVSGPSLGSLAVNISGGMATSGGTGSGWWFWGGTASTSGTISIVYGYTLQAIPKNPQISDSAPEPATLAVTGLALLGLGVVARRKRRRA